MRLHRTSFRLHSCECWNWRDILIQIWANTRYDCGHCGPSECHPDREHCSGKGNTLRVWRRNTSPQVYLEDMSHRDFPLEAIWPEYHFSNYCQSWTQNKMSKSNRLKIFYFLNLKNQNSISFVYQPPVKEILPMTPKTFGLKLCPKIWRFSKNVNFAYLRWATQSIHSIIG